jgi:flagellar biosynthesis/type III secretory pathway protein FliH
VSDDYDEGWSDGWEAGLEEAKEDYKEGYAKALQKIKEIKSGTLTILPPEYERIVLKAIIKELQKLSKGGEQE